MTGKGQMPAKQFLRELEKGNADRLYLFTGEEEGEKEKCISRITDIFLGSLPKDLAVTRYHAESGDLPAALGALTESMFSERRVCVLSNVEFSDRSMLRELIDGLPDSVLLVMTTRENRVPELLGFAAGRMKTVQFWRYFDNDLYRYAGAEARKRGLDMEAGALETLVGLTGSDIRKIDDALERLQFASGPGKIQAEAVRQIILDDRQATVFELIDALFCGDRKVFDILKKVLQGGAPELMILGMVRKQAEQIERYHDAVSRGVSGEEALRTLKLAPRRAGEFRRYVECFTPGRVRALFPLLFRADFGLKSARHSKSFLSKPLFDFIAGVNRICGRGEGSGT